MSQLKWKDDGSIGKKKQRPTSLDDRRAVVVLIQQPQGSWSPDIPQSNRLISCTARDQEFIRRRPSRGHEQIPMTEQLVCAGLCPEITESDRLPGAGRDETVSCDRTQMKIIHVLSIHVPREHTLEAKEITETSSVSGELDEGQGGGERWNAVSPQRFPDARESHCRPHSQRRTSQNRTGTIALSHESNDGCTRDDESNQLLYPCMHAWRGK